jgi:hypothetical protein
MIMIGYNRNKRDKEGEPETDPEMEERQEIRDGNDKGANLAKLV